MRKLFAVCAAILVALSPMAAQAKLLPTGRDVTTLPFDHLSAEVQFINSVPCHPDELGVTSLPISEWGIEIKDDVKACESITFPPATDNTPIDLHTEAANENTGTGDASRAVVIWVVHAPADRPETVTANTDNLGKGVWDIDGADITKDVQTWTIPAGKTGYLIVYTVDYGDQWMGKWIVR